MFVSKHFSAHFSRQSLNLTWYTWPNLQSATLTQSASKSSFLKFLNSPGDPARQSMSLEILSDTSRSQHTHSLTKRVFTPTSISGTAGGLVSRRERESCRTCIRTKTCGSWLCKRHVELHTTLDLWEELRCRTCLYCYVANPVFSCQDWWLGEALSFRHSYCMTYVVIRSQMTHIHLKGKLSNFSAMCRIRLWLTIGDITDVSILVQWKDCLMSHPLLSNCTLTRHLTPSSSSEMAQLAV